MARHIYNAEQIGWLKAHKHLTAEEAALAFNARFSASITFTSIKNARARYRIKSGINKGCFKKGHVPSPDAGPKGPNKTSFAKGRLPHNTRECGDQRTDCDGYRYVKTGRNKWELKHHLLWRGMKGEIPEGHAVIFKDRNPENITLENLVLVSRESLARLNKKFSDLPAGDIRNAAINLVGLESTIRKRNASRN